MFILFFRYEIAEMRKNYCKKNGQQKYRDLNKDVESTTR